jgi:hypothetical protein
MIMMIEKVNQREYFYLELCDDELIKLLTANMLDEIELEFLQDKLTHLNELERLFDKCYGHLTNKERYDLELEGLINFEGFGFPWMVRLIFDKEYHSKIISHCLLADIGNNLTNEETNFTKHGTLGVLDLDLKSIKCQNEENKHFIKSVTTNGENE